MQRWQTQMASIYETSQAAPGTIIGQTDLMRSLRDMFYVENGGYPAYDGY